MYSKSKVSQEKIVKVNSLPSDSKYFFLNNPINKLFKKTNKKEKSNISHKNKHLNTDTALPGVTILTITNRAKNYTNIFKNYIKQHHRLKELIVVVTDEKLDLEQVFEESKTYPMVRIYQLSESNSFKEAVDYGIKHSVFELICVMEDTKIYNNNYINTLLKTYYHINNLCKIQGFENIRITKKQTEGNISTLTYEHYLDLSNTNEIPLLFYKSLEK